MSKNEARGRRPDVMGGQQGGPGAEVMGRPEPDEAAVDVMGGPGWPAEVMRGRVRPAGLPYGARPATDLMGGPGRPADVMSGGRSRPA